MRDRLLGFEGELEIASGNPGMFARKRLRPRALAVLDGLHNRSMMIGRDVCRGRELLELYNTKD